MRWESRRKKGKSTGNQGDPKVSDGRKRDNRGRLMIITTNKVSGMEMVT